MDQLINEWCSLSCCHICRHYMKFLVICCKYIKCKVYEYLCCIMHFFLKLRVEAGCAATDGLLSVTVYLQWVPDKNQAYLDHSSLILWLTAATYVSVGLSETERDLLQLPPRRSSRTCRAEVVNMRVSSADPWQQHQFRTDTQSFQVSQQDMIPAKCEEGPEWGLVLEL